MTQPNRLKSTLNRLLPLRIRTTLRDHLRHLNEDRLALDPALARRLTREYAPGIRRLQALIGQDLSHLWEE